LLSFDCNARLAQGSKQQRHPTVHGI
jgi:hypothetical protein